MTDTSKVMGLVRAWDEAERVKAEADFAYMEARNALRRELEHQTGQEMVGGRAEELARLLLTMFGKEE